MFKFNDEPRYQVAIHSVNDEGAGTITQKVFDTKKEAIAFARSQFAQLEAQQSNDDDETEACNCADEGHCEYCLNEAMARADILQDQMKEGF